MRTQAGPFECVLDAEYSVVMRDGIALATDVYRPARDGRPLDGAFPVILERTPYDKRSPSRSERGRADTAPRPRAEVARYFVSRGYVVVYQDCRGCHRSAGSFTKYLAEAEDGCDTVAWIRAQPWCSGVVGTKGLSYAAHTQVALACLAPPGLGAMVVDSGGFSNAYQSGIRQGGAFELKQVTWAYRQALLGRMAAEDASVRRALEAEDLRAWFERMPWRRGQSPLRWAPEYEEYLFEQWEHGRFDDYWRQLGICAREYYDQFADAATIHISSWYDPYARTATENFVGLRSRKRQPVQLVLGPWTHGDRTLSHAGEVDFGPAAPFDGNVADDFLAFRLRWFDRWLRGIENGAERDPPVRYFRMGGGSGRRTPAGHLDHGGCWLQAADWPIPSAGPLALYLHPGGQLAPRPPAVEGGRVTYAYDPRAPVPSIGGAITSGAPLMEGGAFDQVEGPRFFGCRPPHLPLAARPDVLVFATEPLPRAVEVTGPVTARLWLSSDCPDTDLTIKLIDLYPPSPDYPRGFAMNVTDGILRVRYRDSWEHPRLMTPGEIYEVEVQAPPTSNLFAAGHRIRLDVSSSNFPRFDLNPNTGEDGPTRVSRVAINSIHAGPRHPSVLLLPVVPLG